MNIQYAVYLADDIKYLVCPKILMFRNQIMIVDIKLIQITEIFVKEYFLNLSRKISELKGTFYFLILCFQM